MNADEVPSGVFRGGAELTMAELAAVASGKGGGEPMPTPEFGWTPENVGPELGRIVRVAQPLVMRLPPERGALLTFWPGNFNNSHCH